MALSPFACLTSKLFVWSADPIAGVGALGL